LRWVVAAVLALLLAWAGYFLSPFYAVVQLARAVQSGDSGIIAARVNASAVRIALTRQLLSTYLEVPKIAGDGEARAAAAGIVEQFVAQTMTRDKITELLLAAGASREIAGTPFGGASRPLSLHGIRDLVGSYEQRGFRVFIFSLTPNLPASEQFRLTMRLSPRNGWRMTGLSLPRQVLEPLLGMMLKSEEPVLVASAPSDPAALRFTPQQLREFREGVSSLGYACPAVKVVRATGKDEGGTLLEATCGTTDGGGAEQVVHLHISDAGTLRRAKGQ
jgi:hypothetical protein